MKSEIGNSLHLGFKARASGANEATLAKDVGTDAIKRVSSAS